MSFFSKPRSPLGYYMANKTHDSYGVDHSNFSTRDELEYQWARIEKEQSLMEQEDTLGSSDNYTQYGTNFWGTDPENNYGFGYSALKPETFQSALSIQKQAQLSPQLETTDILDANALTPDTLGEKQPSWLDDILVAQNQLQNGSFGSGLTNSYLNNNTFGLSGNNYLNNNAFASNDTNSYLDNTYLNNNTFGLSDNTYLNNNAFASDDTNSYLDNTYLNNNTFGLSENNYLNNNAFASNGTNSYLDNNVITTNEYDSLFAPLPLNQNSVRFADNPAANMATANNLDWGAIYKALFGVKPAVAGTLDGQGQVIPAHGIIPDPNFVPNSRDYNSEEYTNLLMGYAPLASYYEGDINGAYPDSKYLLTAGRGYHLLDKERVLRSGILEKMQKQYPDRDVYQMLLADFEALKKALQERAKREGKEDYLTKNPYLADSKVEEIKDFREKYPLPSPEKGHELFVEYFKKEGLNRLINALDEYQIDLFKLPKWIQYNLLDIAYNPGNPLYNGKGKKSGWHNLLIAVKNGDWDRVTRELNRINVGAKRNNGNLITAYNAENPAIGDVDIRALFENTKFIDFERQPITKEWLLENEDIMTPLFQKYQRGRR